MKLYQKLKEKNLVENRKDFNELIWLRAISVNDRIIDNPEEVIDNSFSKIKIGILVLD